MFRNRELGMNNSYFWSANAGRWLGIPVRIHVLMFLFVAAIFGIETRLLSENSLSVGTALVTTLVVIGSLILHEMAHIFALSNLGGHVNNILLMPWGGNSDFALPGTSRSRVVVHAAGPFANLIVFLFGSMLLLQTEQASFLGLINPFEPYGFNMAQWESSLLLIVTWVNFQLFAINLVPCFPFDGAGMLRGVIESLNPDLSKIHAESSVRVFGHAFGIAMIAAAWFLANYESSMIGPAWCLLAMFGICLIFSARYSYLVETANLSADWSEIDEMESVSLYEETPFFDFPNDESNGYSQWLSEKQEARKDEEVQLESEELERSDSILEKLHERGIESLSEEEKSLLKRVSDRLRRLRDEQNA